MFHGQMLKSATSDYDQRHVIAFRPISAAARSWSYDKTRCHVYLLTGDAEGQREEHVDQEALEVVENILINYSRVTFMYIANNIPGCVYISSRQPVTLFLFRFTVCVFARRNFGSCKSEKPTE